MTSWQIINCKRCGAIFRKLCGNTCPECVKVIQDASHRMYQYAHDHPNVTLGEIADACGIDIRDAEFVFFDGGLGTASSAIILHCAQCGKSVRQIERRGRLCIHCAERLEEDSRRPGPDRKEQENPHDKERQTVQSAKPLKRGARKESGTLRVGEPCPKDEEEAPPPPVEKETDSALEESTLRDHRPVWGSRYGFIRHRD